MSTINYSKWDHIEMPMFGSMLLPIWKELGTKQMHLNANGISDDEDDTHPNIDTPSLFKWRHEARMERMEKEKAEKEKILKEKQDTQQKLQQMKQKLKESEEKNALEKLEELKKEINDLEKQDSDFRKKEEELKRKERLTPWNIDTICKDGKSKTIINKEKKVEKEAITDEEKAERQVEFTKQHKDKIKKFGMIRKYEDSQEFLMKHPVLVCEETANYLVLWCIDLEIEEKKDLMDHVAHQTIVMQFILELATQLKHDPRDCIRPFFSRIKLAQKEYLDAFNDELEGFKSRVRARAEQKIEEAMKEHEEEERQKRLGPGGLDPVEVFESLPQVLKDCFESKDISMLQDAVLKMEKEEAEYHMKRCVDSGLWVPNAKDQPLQEEGDGADEVYEEVN